MRGVGAIDRALVVTLIQPKPALKIVPLPVTADLSPTALEVALALAKPYPHDSWADLVVHQSGLVGAMRCARLHNGKDPDLRVRVLTDTTLGHSDWKLKTRGVIVTSFWSNKIP